MTLTINAISDTKQTMKKTLVTIAVAALAVSTFAQGTLNVLNTSGSTFRSQIYGPQASDPTISLSGNSSVGNPAGSTAYTGPLLAGTGFTFAVYFGPSTTSDPNTLSPLVSAPFRTGGAAGLISPIPDLVLAGIAPGGIAALQVRAWDNVGGTVTSYGAATIRGASALFLSQPLGGGPLLAPDMTGWQSFNIYIVPEPSTFVLAGLGAASLLIFRRRK